jgi:hypothetical protein
MEIVKKHFCEGLMVQIIWPWVLKKVNDIQYFHLFVCAAAVTSISVC